MIEGTHFVQTRKFDDYYSEDLLGDLTSIITDYISSNILKGYREIFLLYSPELSYDEMDRDENRNYRDLMQNKAKGDYVKMKISFIADVDGDGNYFIASMVHHYRDDKLKNVTFTPGIFELDIKNTTAVINAFFSEVISCRHQYYGEIEYVEDHNDPVILDIIADEYNIDPLVNENNYQMQLALKIKNIMEQARR